MLIKEQISELMKAHSLVYKETPLERIAKNITRLAGDNIHNDITKNNLVMLYQKNLLSKDIVFKMYIQHIREQRQDSVSLKNVFDPFLTYHKSGYLNNKFCIYSMENIKELEHFHFLMNFQDALDYLLSVAHQDYDWRTIAQVHRILFSHLYPWAGELHDNLCPDLVISKGRITFAYPGHIKDIVNLGFNKYLKEPELVKMHIGDIISYLCYAHPFLDGNGRTILTTIHAICISAGFSINWSKIDPVDYLEILTEELEHSGHNILNRYMERFT